MASSPRDLLERGDALSVLERIMERLEVGLGASHFIEGEAGLGKTSLLDAAAYLAGSQVRVVRGRGSASGPHDLLLLSRLAALPEDATRCAEAAAVLGVRFRVALVPAVEVRARATAWRSPAVPTAIQHLGVGCSSRDVANSGLHGRV